MYQGKKVAAIIPAFNEALSIGLVVGELVALDRNGVSVFDQVIVCDNASTDATAQIAADAGAMVVYEPKAGYGRACMRALAEVAPNSIVVFVDGDYSVLTDEIPSLLQKLSDTNTLIIGSRGNSGCEPGAMTPQQIFGNRLASWLMRKLWHRQTTDLGPLRALHMETLCVLDMQEPTYGWTMEMQAKALKSGLAVVEVPVSTRKRLGKSKVSGTWRGTFGAGWGILSTLGRVWLGRYQPPTTTYRSAGIRTPVIRVRRDQTLSQDLVQGAEASDSVQVRYPRTKAPSDQRKTG
ncbi:MAG: glycosyltransferase family 2 protein [Pseudomonadota bacterium]